MLDIGEFSEELPGHDHHAQLGPEIRSAEEPRLIDRPVLTLPAGQSLTVVSGSGGPVHLLALCVSGSEDYQQLEQNLNTILGQVEEGSAVRK